MKLCAKICVILLCVFPYAGYGQANSPFFVFTAAWDPAAIDVVLRHFGNQDFIGQAILQKAKYNHARDGRSSFDLPPSLSLVKEASSKPCKPGGPLQIVIYNPEHWEATPRDELTDLPNSIRRGSTMVKQSTCRLFGVAPGGDLLGLQRRQCAASPSPLAESGEWKKVDFVVLQAQRLLAEPCGTDATKTYSKFIKEWATKVRQVNPAIKIVAQLSFQYSDANEMRNAIAATQDVVDGYYLAYPSGKNVRKCEYCDAQNLEAVLTKFR